MRYNILLESYRENNGTAWPVFGCVQASRCMKKLPNVPVKKKIRDVFSRIKN